MPTCFGMTLSGLNTVINSPIYNSFSRYVVSPTWKLHVEMLYVCLCVGVCVVYGCVCCVWMCVLCMDVWDVCVILSQNIQLVETHSLSLYYNLCTMYPSVLLHVIVSHTSTSSLILLMLNSLS